MDALRALDTHAAETSSRYRRVVRKRRIFSRGIDQSGHSQLTLPPIFIQWRLESGRR
jgi:hypothetical protein